MTYTDTQLTFVLIQHIGMKASGEHNPIGGHYRTALEVYGDSLDRTQWRDACDLASMLRTLNHCFLAMQGDLNSIDWLNCSYYRY